MSCLQFLLGRVTGEIPLNCKQRVEWGLGYVMVFQIKPISSLTFYCAVHTNANFVLAQLSVFLDSILILPNSLIETWITMEF